MRALKFAIYPLVCVACAGLVACQPDGLQPERSAQAFDHVLAQADEVMGTSARAD